MPSIKKIYKQGKGPSSSHTMGPERAARSFLAAHPEADAFRVILYGSLSKTGVGHGTDQVLRETFAPRPADIQFSDEPRPPTPHPHPQDHIALQEGEETGRQRGHPAPRPAPGGGGRRLY